MLSTKTFAELCCCTKKTIIYYDRIGLLKPKKLNDKGFRYYIPQQVLVFQKIQMLKSFGMSLADINKFINHGSMLKKIFNKQKKELNTKKEVLVKRINKLDEFILALKQGKTLIHPKIKTIKTYSFFAQDKKGRYVDIHSHQIGLFDKIKDKQAHHVGLTVFYDDQYSPHQANMTTGAILTDNEHKKPPQYPEIKIISVPKHKALTCSHVGPYSYMSYVWQFLIKYKKENKYKAHPQLASRELYIVGSLSGANEDDFVTELQIPILL